MKYTPCKAADQATATYRIATTELMEVMRYWSSTVFLLILSNALIAENLQVDVAQTLINATKSSAEKAKLQYEEGSKLFEQDQYSKCVEYYVPAYNYYQATDPGLAAAVANDLALCFYNIGEYDRCLEKALFALRYYESSEERLKAVAVLNTLGLLYTQLLDYSLALEHLNEARSILHEEENVPLLTATLKHISSVYFEQERYEESLALDFYSVELSRELSDTIAVAAMLNNIGAHHVIQNELDSALTYYFSSLNLTDISFDTLGAAITRGNIGEVYAMRGDRRAIEFLVDAADMARANDDKQTLARNYSRLAEFYAQEGQFEKAFEYQEQYLRVNERVYNDKSNKRIANLQVVYETEKREKDLELSMAEVSLLRVESEHQNEKYKWLLGIAVALVALALMLIWVVRQKILVNRQQQAIYEQQRAVDDLKDAARRSENQQLKTDLDHKNRELSSAAMHMHNKNDILMKLNEELENVASSAKDSDQVLRSIARSIQENLRLDSDWKTFLEHFKEVHPSFVEKLKSNFHRLTDNDLRHCAYLRMNLTTKEIAQLMNIAPPSVQMSRVRLKKKMGLGKGQSLHDYLSFL